MTQAHKLWLRIFKVSSLGLKEHLSLKHICMCLFCCLVMSNYDLFDLGQFLELCRFADYFLSWRPVIAFFCLCIYICLFCFTPHQKHMLWVLIWFNIFQHRTQWYYLRNLVKHWYQSHSSVIYCLRIARHFGRSLHGFETSLWPVQSKYKIRTLRLLRYYIQYYIY